MGIPATFHFGYFRGAKNWDWTEIHTLCIKSCHHFAKAETIIVHYDRDGEGPAWDAVKALPYVSWTQVEPTWTQNGVTLTDQRAFNDVFRLRTLYTQGGWYCDLDFIFIKSFEGLAGDAEAVIGIQNKQRKKLAAGLMGCVPGAAFIKAYLDKYENYSEADMKKFWVPANVWPWELSQIHPVKLIERNVLYPFGWSNVLFWSGKPVPLKKARAVHLWESLYKDADEAALLKSCLAPYIQELKSLIL